MMERGMTLTRFCSHAPDAALLPARVGQASPLISWLGSHRILRQLVAHVYFSGVLPLPVQKWGCVLKVSPSGKVLGEFRG